MKLTINKLSKTYGNNLKALEDIDLEIGQGMFGFLGPNGAGKSTLMRIIATVQLPDTGRILFNKIDALKDPVSLRKVLGYLPQDFGIYPGVNAEDLLNYFAVLKGISSSKERKKVTEKALELTNLNEFRKMNVSNFSGGMKQRFGIAQILLNDPKLIIVDEPTTGLDPAERKRFLNLLREMASSNIIIFSTHIVDDINDFCKSMAIINRGKILKTGSPSDSVRELKNKIWKKRINPYELSEMEKIYKVISTEYNEDNSINIRAYSEIKPSPEFAAAEPCLEDLYFTTLDDSSHSVRI
ncbi:MAG: ABC transporter ATP-binding protein [Ignavibacteria bacterium]|nr:ABC transporter ATP-binding protein [Ignavibacteria bacterium]